MPSTLKKTKKAGGKKNFNKLSLINIDTIALNQFSAAVTAEKALKELQAAG